MGRCVWKKPSAPHSYGNPYKHTLHSTHLTPQKKRYCWYQRLKECSVSSLKKYLRIIYTVQWLIIHLYIHHTSVVKHLKQYKLTFFFFFFKLTLHIGTCKAALVSTLESTVNSTSLQSETDLSAQKSSTAANLGICTFTPKERSWIKIGREKNKQTNKKSPKLLISSLLQSRAATVPLIVIHVK